MSEFFQIEDDAPTRRVLYASAILLITVPLLQAISTIWPMQFGNIQWRFGAANALSSVLLLPFLGLVLLLVVSRMLASRPLSLIVGVISTLFAIALAGSFVLFVLDGLQLKAIVNSAQMASFESVFARVGLITLLFAIVYLLLALAGLKGPKVVAGQLRKGGVKPADDGVGLIVGRA
jgi:hypothetical protein